MIWYFSGLCWGYFGVSAVDAMGFLEVWEKMEKGQEVAICII